jgi:hypothetical protein
MAKHWTRLADTYQFNLMLERFLHAMHKAGRPFHVEDIPKPPVYDDEVDEGNVVSRSRDPAVIPGSLSCLSESIPTASIPRR